MLLRLFLPVGHGGRGQLVPEQHSDTGRIVGRRQAQDMPGGRNARPVRLPH